MNEPLKDAVTELYEQLIEAWNTRNAKAFAALFSNDATCIGFDGSQLLGRKQIESSLTQIFEAHPTAAYYTIIRDVKQLAEKCWMLRANVGMVPPEKRDIDSSKNAIQIMTVRLGNTNEIVVFQNTPAQFHGRPDLAESLTKELRDLVKVEI
jgi:uncharacterized protein (TIGR02246 family)